MNISVEDFKANFRFTSYRSKRYITQDNKIFRMFASFCSYSELNIKFVEYLVSIIKGTKNEQDKLNNQTLSKEEMTKRVKNFEKELDI